MELKKLLFLALLLPLLFAGCKKVDQPAVDRDLILEYIENNNLNALEGEEGLFYVINTEGTGARPTINDDVTCTYVGFLLDGTQFDPRDPGTPNNTATFPLLGVIRGWQLGIPLIKEGGSITLLIPSALGYGSSPPPGSLITKDAVLRFEVDLIEVG